jgi:outer membrane immunogenic protein
VQVISKTPRGSVKKFNATEKSFGAFPVARRGLKISIFLASAAIAICIAAATPANAADVELPSSYDWSGPYIGLQGGFGWGSNNEIDVIRFGAPTDDQLSLDDKGYFGGLHAGYSYLNGSFLYGVEGDLEYSGIRSDTAIEPGIFNQFDKSIDWLGSLRLRGGVTLDRALLYATGGLAFGDVNMQTTDSVTSISNRELALGWTVGAGVEYAITDSLSANIEYRYTDLADTQNTGEIFFGQILTFDHENRLQAVRAGVSWHF